MAIYKYEAIQKFGKFYGALYKASDAKPNVGAGEAFASTEALAENLTAQINNHGLDEDDDSIIWRNDAYEDFSALARAVRMASY